MPVVPTLNRNYDQRYTKRYGENDMIYECQEATKLGGWVVEAVGDEGEVYVAQFYGPKAEERAKQYQQSMTGLAYAEIAGAVARGWCDPKNASKEMDTDLAMAIAGEVAKLISAGA